MACLVAATNRSGLAKRGHFGLHLPSSFTSLLGLSTSSLHTARLTVVPRVDGRLPLPTSLDVGRGVDLPPLAPPGPLYPSYITIWGTSSRRSHPNPGGFSLSLGLAVTR